MAQPTRYPGENLPKLKFVIGAAAVIACFMIAGCTSHEQPTPVTDPGSGNLLNPSTFEATIKESQRALAEGKGAADTALFNLGVASAHSLNPNKDYPRALLSFKTLVKDYPQSPRAEQAKIWIQALEQMQRNSDEKQKLAEEKRSLSRERDKLSQEREKLSQERDKLNYANEKSRLLDAEIEKRRRQSLNR